MPILAASFSLFDKLRCKTVQAEKIYTAAGNKTIRKISLLDKLDNIAAIWGQDAADAETQREELIAQTVAALASDENAFMKAVQIKENKSLLDKVREALKTIIEHVKKFFRDVDEQGRKYGHNIQAQPWLDDLKALEGLAEKFSEMMTAVRENEAAYGARESEVRFEKIGVNKYGIEVYQTSEKTLNLSHKQRKQEFLRLLNNEYANKKIRFVRNGHTYYAEFDKKNIRKPVFGEKHNSPKGQKALFRAGADGDIIDLFENVEYKSSKADSKKHKSKDGFTDYFDYFYKTVQIDNKVYDLCVNVKKEYGDNRGYIYTFFLTDNKKKKAFPATTQKNRVVTMQGPLSTNNISQATQKSNTVSTIQGKKSKNDTFYFDDIESLKERQNSIVQQNNSMHDDYHTGIRGVEDIYTFEEALGSGEYEEGEDFTPDYTWRMAQRAVSSGKITVYSSYPIKQGVFVTPSKMEAEGYSGSGRTYKKTVALTDVAWIDPIQGQYYSTVYLILLIHSRCYKLLIRSFHQNLYFVSFCF